MIPRDEYINLVKSIKRFDNEYREKLLEKLDTCGFYNAPASTKYHSSYPGGLVEHSLEVYYTMTTINRALNLNLDEESIRIVSLFHDLSKADLYEKYIQNKKVYTPDGTKYDSMGKYEWVAEESFKTAEPEKRLLMGSRAVNSYFIISQYLPLTLDESRAIINQYAGSDKTDVSEDIYSILNNSSLTVLLHVADMLSSYVLEKHEKE